MTPLDDRDPVDVLAEEFVSRMRRGEHPSVSDYAAEHPNHAEQLLELLPAVAQMEYLKKFRRANGLAPEPPRLPDRFGDFRIVRELGRGGMGVVFEAVQESLGRPVALKVLATHSQFDVVRHERFIREAHAAARLHHTNIVPVFGVGEQDSIPYYVMQLIRGQGLNAVAQRWRREKKGNGGESAHIPTPFAADLGSAPTPATRNLRESIPHAFPVNRNGSEVGKQYGDWRFVAEVGLQAADALHYAHKQGVLHRDVKPANLLLDSSNRVWITDFGLAKLIDRNGLTASGDILGTLQYLAPECLSGDSDPRSDVYGVGATLYELLTLIPPYPHRRGRSIPIFLSIWKPSYSRRWRGNPIAAMSPLANSLAICKPSWKIGQSKLAGNIGQIESGVCTAKTKRLQHSPAPLWHCSCSLLFWAGLGLPIKRKRPMRR
jgi:eukaryotic-like serine/threonine-protein kinase